MNFYDLFPKKEVYKIKSIGLKKYKNEEQLESLTKVIDELFLRLELLENNR